MKRLWLVPMAVAMSCGGAAKDDETNPGQSPPEAESASSSHTAPAHPAPETPPNPPTEAQCNEFLDNVLTVSRQAQNRGAKEEKVTQADEAKVRAEFKKANLPHCMKLQKSEVACGIAAQSTQALAACSNGPNAGFH